MRDTFLISLSNRSVCPNVWHISNFSTLNTWWTTRSSVKGMLKLDLPLNLVVFRATAKSASERSQVCHVFMDHTAGQKEDEHVLLLVVEGTLLHNARVCYRLPKKLAATPGFHISEGLVGEETIIFTITRLTAPGWYKFFRALWLFIVFTVL